MYLGNTLYRIHGTNQPSTIGTFVSSGCIRLTNDDVADLYSRVECRHPRRRIAGNDAGYGFVGAPAATRSLRRCHRAGDTLADRCRICRLRRRAGHFHF